MKPLRSCRHLLKVWQSPGRSTQSHGNGGGVTNHTAQHKASSGKHLDESQILQCLSRMRSSDTSQWSQSLAILKTVDPASNPDVAVTLGLAVLEGTNSAEESSVKAAAAAAVGYFELAVAAGGVRYPDHVPISLGQLYALAARQHLVLDNAEAAMANLRKGLLLSSPECTRLYADHMRLALSHWNPSASPQEHAPSPEVIVKLYQKAVSLGDRSAPLTLGWILETGTLGCAVDRETAVTLYRIALDRGNVPAAANLGRLLLEEGRAVEAVAALREGVAAQDPLSFVNLAGCLLTGRGVEEIDSDGAEELLRSAALAGSIDAMANLGLLLESHRPTDPCDPADVLHVLRNEPAEQSASKEANRCQEALNTVLEGRPPRLRKEESLLWLCAASSAGHSVACYNLANLLIHHPATSPTAAAMAVRLFRSALATKLEIAREPLARCYLLGVGTAVNAVAAMHLYSSKKVRQAASSGIAFALSKILLKALQRYEDSKTRSCGPRGDCSNDVDSTSASHVR